MGEKKSSEWAFKMQVVFNWLQMIKITATLQMACRFFSVLVVFYLTGWETLVQNTNKCPSVPLSAVLMASTFYGDVQHIPTSLLCWLHAQSPWQSTNKANHLADVANSVIVVTHISASAGLEPQRVKKSLLSSWVGKSFMRRDTRRMLTVSIRRFKPGLNCNTFRRNFDYYYVINWLCKIYVPPIFKFSLFKISLKSAFR